MFACAVPQAQTGTEFPPHPVGMCVPGTYDAWDCALALCTAHVSAQLQTFFLHLRGKLTPDKMLAAGAGDHPGWEKS